ncbi:MAG: osmoprotectant transport system ATP-binding protein [Lysobacterales bacterium]|jgi:osmoprotectant transport system ATP-binding protein
MINFEGVTKHYGTALAVDNFSCEFQQGRTHVLLGSSGCGKTTLLRLILGLVPPDEGWVRVEGRPMSSLTRRELVSEMGYVVQQGGLFPHLNNERNVSLAAEAQNWSRERISHRTAELVKLVGFDDAIMKKYPTELSGGQRQRVSIMRALMLDPPILLLDEPLGSLDPIVRDGLQVQLKEIFEALGKTVMLVTHDIREAAILGNTITLMTGGRLVQHGSFEDLASRPANGFVSEFLRAQELPLKIQDYLQ